MYGLNHGFRFIDPIKTKRSKFLELFDLTLNIVNIETDSKCGVFELKYWNFLKCYFQVHRCLFQSFFFHIYFFYHAYNINESYFVHLFQ